MSLSFTEIVESETIGLVKEPDIKLFKADYEHYFSVTEVMNVFMLTVDMKRKD